MTMVMVRVRRVVVIVRMISRVIVRVTLMK